MRFHLTIGFGNFRIGCCTMLFHPAIGFLDLRFGRCTAFLYLTMRSCDFIFRICLRFGDLCLRQLFSLRNLHIGFQSGSFGHLLCLIYLGFGLLTHLFDLTFRLFLKVQKLHLHLPPFIFQLKLNTFTFLFSGHTKFRLLTQFLLRVKLSLSHFLHKDLSYLHIRYIAVIDKLFLYLFDKLRVHRFLFLDSHFLKITLITLDKTLKYGIIGDQVRIHLDHVFFVEFQCRIPFLDRIADLVIAFQKLPQFIAGPIVRILHQQVRSLNRASNDRAPLHQTAEGTVSQCHNKTSDTVDTHEYVHIIAVIFNKALTFFDLHLNLIFDFLISVIHFTFKFKIIADLIACRPEDHICTFIDEGHKLLDKMIDKTVFIHIIAFFNRNIQNSCRLDIPVLIACDKLGIHTQMPNAVRSDLLCQSHRNNLLTGRNKSPWLIYDLINRIKALLNRCQPSLIDNFMKHLIRLMKSVVTGLNHLKQILKIPVIFQGLSHTADIFQIQILNRVIHNNPSLNTGSVFWSNKPHYPAYFPVRILSRYTR